MCKACVSNVLHHFSAEQMWFKLLTRSVFSLVNEDRTEVALMLFACSIPGSLLIAYSAIARNTVRVFAKSREGENKGMEA